jgi:hypothetical protein
MYTETKANALQNPKLRLNSCCEVDQNPFSFVLGMNHLFPQAKHVFAINIRDMIVGPIAVRTTRFTIAIDTFIGGSGREDFKGSLLDLERPLPWLNSVCHDEER